MHSVACSCTCRLRKRFPKYLVANRTSTWRVCPCWLQVFDCKEQYTLNKKRYHASLLAWQLPFSEQAVCAAWVKCLYSVKCCKDWNAITSICMPSERCQEQGKLPYLFHRNACSFTDMGSTLHWCNAGGQPCRSSCTGSRSPSLCACCSDLCVGCLRQLPRACTKRQHKRLVTLSAPSVRHMFADAGCRRNTWPLPTDRQCCVTSSLAWSIRIQVLHNSCPYHAWLCMSCHMERR